MRRLLLIGCLTALAAASPALAQSRASAQAAPSGQTGLRYLTWPGKAAAPSAPAAPVRAPYRAPARNAPALAPAVRQAPPPAPAPLVQAVAPAPAPEQQPPEPVAEPLGAPVQPALAHDPNAPRADALIQRLAAHRRVAQQAAAVSAPLPPAAAAPAPSAAPSAAPAPEGPQAARPEGGQQPVRYETVAGARPAIRGERPRYYSLHRDSGRTPDPVPLTAGFFQPTADLAEPPALPQTAQQMRAANAGVTLESDAQP
ncbi:MAG TPA: hypothetical protein VGB49_02040 [Caulobacteraceae bacterium]